MAKLDEYWGKIKESDSFKDLDTAQQEKVRSKLWDQYVQKSPSYINLPLSQRNQVRKHFDDLTKIVPEGFMEGVARKGKKIVEAAKPILSDAKDVILENVDPSAIAKTASEFYATGEKLPGVDKAKEFVKEGFEQNAQAIEPSEQAMGDVYNKLGTVSSWSPQTQFDMARMIASAAIRTAGEFTAGLIPENNIDVALFFTDPIFKFAGTTYLGKILTKERVLPWKIKTGLSNDAVDLGSQLEKIITKRRIENNARSVTDGPARPLEVLANKEAELKARNEVAQYEDWLQRMDSISPSGGDIEGDLYPAAKTNISQLRDMAKERLQKLQNEPVRVESLAKSEDALLGYYRRRVDQSRVYMMPPGPVSEPQALLQEGPRPAGLLGPGEPPKPIKKTTTQPTPAPERPSPSIPPNEAAAAPVQDQVFKAKDTLLKMYQSYNPDQSKQANAVRAGTLLKSLGFAPNRDLSREEVSMLEKILEVEHSERIAKEAKVPIEKAINKAKIIEKGLDPAEVRSEAERLYAEHNFRRESLLEKRNTLKQVTGGIGFHDKDPMTGRIPEREEVLRNVPLDLRGKTKPDQAAMAAYEAGLIKSPTSSDLYEYTRSLEAAGKPRSVNSFLDQAEYNLEYQRLKESGFKPEEQSLPGMPQSEMSGSPIKPPSVPQEEGEMFDLKEESSFNLLADYFKEMGEKGQLGPGDEIDPVKAAKQQAIIEELVDRAMALGYQTTQDIMMYAARNAPKEFQDAIRKNLSPTLSPFDTHAYQEMDEAAKGNPVAKKSMMDAAQRGYFQTKAEIIKGKYRKFKANQQVVLFKDMDEGLMRLKNDLFIHDNYRKFSKDELAAQRWYIEGKSPKLESLTALGIKEEDAKRWLNLAKNPTENMKKAREATQIFEDEYYDVLSEFYDKAGYVDDHVTRRWKRDREYIDWEGRTLGNKPNFLKGRKLLSQADGIDAGFEPISFDIRDDLRASNNARVNILSRIHAYQKLGASFGPDGMPAIIDESKDLVTQAKNAKITPHQGEAPASWIRTNDIPLLRGLAINPYYKPTLKFMMARPFKGTVPEVLNFLAASTKAATLYGLFHAYTLGEMLLTGISYRDVFSFSKDRNVLYRGLKYAAKGMTEDLGGKPLSKNPIKAIGELYDSFRTGSGMLANRPLALDMTEHGFKFGSADEDMHNILKKSLTETENFLSKRIGEGLAKGLTALPRTAIDIQEAFLWRYLRPISSMLVYETNLKDAILKFNIEAAEGKKIPIEEIKKMIVSQTSKEMGGISYARLMIDPRTQQVLQWLMLAPGWTIGRALMGASVLDKGPEGRQARKQMAKLFTAWFFASNMINYAQTKKHLGKGRYMWENPEGYKNQAFLSKEDDGSR